MSISKRLFFCLFLKHLHCTSLEDFHKITVEFVFTFFDYRMNKMLVCREVGINILRKYFFCTIWFEEDQFFLKSEANIDFVFKGKNSLLHCQIQNFVVIGYIFHKNSHFYVKKSENPLFRCKKVFILAFLVVRHHGWLTKPIRNVDWKKMYS